MQKSEPNRIVNLILAIILVLFASLAAPKLPKSITKYLENPWLRLITFIAIAYLATKDLVTALIAVIAVSISYQTLSMHKITDIVMDKTTHLLNNIQIPITNSTDDSNQTQDETQNVYCMQLPDDIQIIDPTHPIHHINSPHPMHHIDSPHPTHIDSPHPMHHINSPHPMHHINSPHPMHHINSPHPMHHIDSPHPTHIDSPHPTQHIDSPHPTQHINSPHFDNANELSDIELYNKLIVLTKQIIDQSSNIDKATIIASILKTHPHINIELINSAVNRGFNNNNPLESSNNKMSIDDNEISLLIPYNYHKKNTIKYLQNNNQLPDDYEELNINSLEDINNNNDTLTDICTTEHSKNYNCGNNHNIIDTNSDGFEYDFQNYGLV